MLKKPAGEKVSEKTLYRHGFRLQYRGEEPSRIEALSDAAFALAITLLVISQSVPKTFGELKLLVADLVPFAFCIAAIMLLWHRHFIFFLRYGFRDSRITVLNSVLLFLLLFYVYPLKFLAQLLTNIFFMPFILGKEEAYQAVDSMVSPTEMPLFMVIYGLGASAIFLVFALMHRYAYQKREELQLSDIETFDTRSDYYYQLVMASVPLFSVFLALCGILFGLEALGNLAGVSYALYWPAISIFSKKRSKLRKLRFRKAEAEVEEMVKEEIGVE